MPKTYYKALPKFTGGTKNLPLKTKPTTYPIRASYYIISIFVPREKKAYEKEITNGMPIGGR
jgi:hypothetical protein